MILTTTTTTSQEAPGLQRQSRQASPELSFLCWPRVHSGAEDKDDEDDEDDDYDDYDDDDDDDDNKAIHLILIMIFTPKLQTSDICE